jgi:alcohol dehydrogenase (quinone), cytochrome c subunit
MNTLARRSHRGRGWLYAVLVLIALVVLAWLPTVALSGEGNPGAPLPVPLTDALVARGAYLARVGDCAACHTAPGGKAYAGGLPIASPIGTIYASNITPDPQTGIGNYAYGDFERAVRRGISRSRKTLYPAMPYPSYATINDADLQALYAYFAHGVAPVVQANRKTDIAWPLSMRWPLAYWRWLYAPSVPPARRESSDPQIAHGAYLVEGLGHCGACHTPRAVTLHEKVLSDQGGTQYLSGNVVDHWVAPSLRGDAASGLGSIDKADLITLLKGGRNEHGAIFGSMGDVVTHSTQYMTDEDIDAIASYLKSLSPASREQALAYDPTTAKALHAGDVARAGAQLYVDNCATCHRTDGHGYAQTFPSLALNPVVNTVQPDSLIHLVLHGGAMPGTQTAPTQFGMPAFGSRLSDQEVAELLTFVRSSWGNKAPAVDAAKVSVMRHALPAAAPVMTDYDPRAMK